MAKNLIYGAWLSPARALVPKNSFIVVCMFLKVFFGIPKHTFKKLQIAIKLCFGTWGAVMDYYLYVIRSGDKQYTGTTKSIKNRLKRHNSGQNRSTKHLKNWKLVHFEKFNTLSEARRREIAVKKVKKRFG